MSRGFVKTAVVLPSEDGISMGAEERVESDEVRLQDELASRAGTKSLYEQLEDEKMKKQEEYDKVTKMIFAGPKTLDEEDITYLDEVAERQKRRKEIIQQQENHDLGAFKAARLTRTLNAVPEPDEKSHDKHTVEPRKTQQGPVIAKVETKVKLKAKRRISDKQGKNKKAKTQQGEGSTTRHTTGDTERSTKDKDSPASDAGASPRGGGVSVGVSVGAKSRGGEHTRDGGSKGSTGDDDDDDDGAGDSLAMLGGYGSDDSE